ncbi:MAG: pepsin-like aspartic protease [Pseudomonadota bacterium]
MAVTLVGCQTTNVSSPSSRIDASAIELTADSSGSARDFISVPVSFDDDAGGYMMPIQAGANETSVLLDTGSSNLLFGGAGCHGCPVEGYKPSAPCVNYGTVTVDADNCDMRPGDDFRMSYDDGGHAEAKQICDVLSLGGADGKQLTFGVMTSSVDVPQMAGLGFWGNAEPGSQPLCPLKNWVAAAYDLDYRFELQFCRKKPTGYIRFGTAAYPASDYHFFDMLRTRVGENELFIDYRIELDSLVGVIGNSVTTIGSFDVPDVKVYYPIIDSGTTDLVVTAGMMKALVPYLSRNGPEKLYASGSDYYVKVSSSSDIAAFPRLAIQRGDTRIEIPPENYWKLIDRTAFSSIYELRIYAMADPSDDVLLGLPLLENVNAVFDTNKAQLGFRQLDTQTWVVCNR